MSAVVFSASVYIWLAVRASCAGAIWPSSVGEWIAARLTWHGCLVPKHGCVKYDPKVSVRSLYAEFVCRSPQVRPDQPSAVDAHC